MAPHPDRHGAVRQVAGIDATALAAAWRARGDAEGSAPSLRGHGKSEPIAASGDWIPLPFLACTGSLDVCQIWPLLKVLHSERD